MIIWCDKDYLTIASDIEPCTTVQKPLPSDSKQEKELKQKKPYLNKRRVVFAINYLGTEYLIPIKRGYTYDGATIPFGFRWLIGTKGSPEFLNPALIHDVMCETHSLIENDRQLSSIIFREMLIASGVNKIKAYTMYYAVDNFQKFCNW